jgi:hypothetical protein
VGCQSAPAWLPAAEQKQHIPKLKKKKLFSTAVKVASILSKKVALDTCLQVVHFLAYI